jgi:hypothetical protein
MGYCFLLIKEDSFRAKSLLTPARVSGLAPTAGDFENLRS